MKIPVKSIVGTAGLAIAIIWSVHGVNFEEVTVILKNMNVFMTIIVLILTLLNLLVRAMEWKLIVNPLKTIPLINAFSSYVLGVFTNLFLPFKLGDLAQGYSLGKKHDISKIAAVSTVLLQRIFEMSSLLLLMAVVALVFSFPLLFSRRTLIFGLLIIIGVSLLFLLFEKRESVIAWLELVLGNISPRLSGNIGKSFDLFISGTKAMHNLPGVLKILSVSLFSWLVQIVMVWVTARALGISIDLVSSAVVLLIINLGLAIPIAPGNIGTFQFFSIIALSLFSVPKSQALIFSIIFQIIQGIPVLIGGGLSLLSETLHSKKKDKIAQSNPDDRGEISSGNALI